MYRLTKKGIPQKSLSSSNQGEMLGFKPNHPNLLAALLQSKQNDLIVTLLVFVRLILYSNVRWQTSLS